MLHPTLEMAGFLHVGTLARVGISGSTAPREIAEDVDGADWSPEGNSLAVLRLDRNNNADILDYPLGKAVYQCQRPDWLSHVRISPDGHFIAVLQHSGLNDDRGRMLVFDTAGASCGWGTKPPVVPHDSRVAARRCHSLVMHTRVGALSEANQECLSV